MPVLLNALYPWQKEGFELHSSNDSCWNSLPVFALHCFTLCEGKNMSCVQHETVASGPCIQYLSGRKSFGGMTYTIKQDLGEP